MRVHTPRSFGGTGVRMRGTYMATARKAAKKSPAKKTSARKPVAKKTMARKPAAKKASARKPAAKRR